MTSILDTPRDHLLTWLEPFGQPRMRYRQILRWLLQGRAATFDQMSDLPLALRQQLSTHFLPLVTQIERHQEAKDRTHKLLLRVPGSREGEAPAEPLRLGGSAGASPSPSKEAQFIECVLIQEDDRHTACISTQVGCGMGCVFCASGINGVVRNLTAGEILEQLLRLRNLQPAEQRLTHIVVMGMGEPLANLDNLLTALESAGSKDGLDIGARHITISTVGLPAKIRRLADLGKQYHLAVSLHAPGDDLRTQIVPTNDKTGIEDILAAADYFFERTGRQVTYEYVLLHGLNDRQEHARQLARLLGRRKAHVNLIPFNEVSGLPYQRPSAEAVHAFTQVLQAAGLSVKVRKRKGSDIDAACGQLRRQAQGLQPLGLRQPELTAGSRV